jgi:nuclear pore complex protein Nup205
MEDVDGFEAFEALHRDLEALRENRLPNIERLSTELRAHIVDFQNLLDHKKKNEESRRQLASGAFLAFVRVPARSTRLITAFLGTIEVDDVVYSINEDFRQQTIQIAEELDLDEIECAKLFLEAQNDSQDLDRSPIVSAVMRFHKRRQFLLESLRIAFAAGQDIGLDDNEQEDENAAAQQEEQDEQEKSAREMLEQFTRSVLEFGDNQIQGPSRYWQKCISAMQEIEHGLQRVADRTHRASVIGQSLSQEEDQIMKYERDTLNIQHESLGAIAAFLVGHGNLNTGNFRSLLAKVKTLDRHDLVMTHYLPVLMCLISQFGSAGASCSEEDSTALHEIILADKDTERWPLRSFYYAIMSWWIVEYKGRFPDSPYADPTDDNPDSESQILTKCLKEGGLLFMLSIAQDVKHSDWHDPARVGLTSFLLRDTAVLPEDSPRPTGYFQDLVMNQFQVFVDAFISNMPDTLRLLKFEEDDQRKLLRSRFQNSTAEYQYHLDIFLVLISYAYEDCPEAAKAFWSEPDANLYGFLQWAAKRQTTPRVAAFCQMLKSISEGSDCAGSAHAFLLEEGAPVPGKLRRTASLSWNQIFAELEFCSSSSKDRPATVPANGPPNAQNPMEQIVEPESDIMLECYLRLISHLCLGSDAARTWLLNSENPSLPVILFQLCRSNIETRLRACAFATLASLLANKTTEIGDNMWFMLDQWLVGGMSTSSLPPRMPPGTGTAPEQRTFELIATGFEEPNAFMQLLNALVLPSTSEFRLNDSLVFPENLGAPYRLPGIELYVDFAVGEILAEKTTRISDEHQRRLLYLNCVDFICSCLSSFNEDLVIIANKSNLPVEATMRSTSLEAYIRLHPFARVMEWIFEDKVADALFAAAHADVEEVNHAATDSPLVLSLVRAIEAMNFIMKLQSTYVDIVRPTVKRLAPNRKPVTHSVIASFEDMVLKHLDLIVDLGLYCGLGHAQLSVCALALLERLASSRKLMVSSSANFSKRPDRSKLISALEKDGEGERISRSMMASMLLDWREFEAGPLSSGYIIKAGIIAFLKNCLSTLSDRPTIAHLLLGFICKPTQLEIDANGMFTNQGSLFHSVARLALDYPDGADGSFCSWASNIKESSTEIIHTLWRSPLSSALVMTELRASEYIFLQAIRQNVVSATTFWDGRQASDPEFLLTESAISLRNFLRQRTAYYDYLARELAIAKSEGMTSLRARLESVLLGSTIFQGEQPVPSPTIFDLFDFMEVEFGPGFAIPESKHFKESDFAPCKTDDGYSGSVNDLARAEQIALILRNGYLGKRPQGKELVTKDAVKQDEALKTWVQLMVVALSTCTFAGSPKAEFVQHAFQLVLPKFERTCSEHIDGAVQLAGLLNTLMTASSISLKENEPNPFQSQVFDPNNDQEFHVFRTALNGITSHSGSAELRGLCYHLCSQFLHKADQVSGHNSTRQRQILRNIKLLGERLIDIACEDAYIGSAASRVSALLFLEGLVAMFAHDDAKLIMDAFGRLNFVGVLLDSVKQIPSDLRQAQPAGMHPLPPLAIRLTKLEIPIVLAYHNAFLALILRICQTRIGATQVLHGGLFLAVQESQIFSSDPDVGLGKCLHNAGNYIAY